MLLVFLPVIPENLFQMLFLKVRSEHSCTDRFVSVSWEIAEAASGFMHGDTILLQHLSGEFFKAVRVTCNSCNLRAKFFFFSGISCSFRLDTGSFLFPVFLVKNSLATSFCPVLPVSYSHLGGRKQIDLIEVLTLA